MKTAGRRKKKVDLSGKSSQELREFYKENMLNYLSRRRSSQDLRRYLARLECPEEMIRELVEFSEEYHFSDDMEYARVFIRDSFHLRHRSRKRIRYDLLQKGISRDVIDLAMEEENPSDEEAAAELVRKKLIGPSDPQQLRKCGAYLQGQGFSYDIIERVLKNTESQ